MNVTISISFIMIENSSGVNWGPLSVTNCCGKLFAEEICLKSSTVLLVVVVDIGSISCHSNKHPSTQTAWSHGMVLQS